MRLYRLLLWSVALSLTAAALYAQCKPGASCCAAKPEWLGCPVTAASSGVTAASSGKLPLLQHPDVFRDRTSGAIYENLTLECGCPVLVLKPDSYECMFDKDLGYPDLAAALREVYRLAKLHEDKQR